MYAHVVAVSVDFDEDGVVVAAVAAVAAAPLADAAADDTAPLCLYMTADFDCAPRR